MATKKAPVAGSVQGPAVIDPANSAGTNQDSATGSTGAEGAGTQEGAPDTTMTLEPTPAPILAPEAPAEPFPRAVVIVNETPMPHIVAATYVAPGETASVVVRNQDEITRIETDCAHLMELTPAFAELPVQPLRVVDDAAQ